MRWTGVAMASSRVFQSTSRPIKFLRVLPTTKGSGRKIEKRRVLPSVPTTQQIVPVVLHNGASFPTRTTIPLRYTMPPLNFIQQRVDVTNCPLWTGGATTSQGTDLVEQREELTRWLEKYEGIDGARAQRDREERRVQQRKRMRRARMGLSEEETEEAKKES